MDRYRIPVPNGRFVGIGADQVRRIARGLGDHLDAPLSDGQDPPIVRALCALPISQRADAPVKNDLPNCGDLGIEFNQRDVVSEIKFGDCQTDARPTGEGFEKMLRTKIEVP